VTVLGELHNAKKRAIRNLRKGNPFSRKLKDLRFNRRNNMLIPDTEITMDLEFSRELN